MKYVECPNTIDHLDGNFLSIFMAGGISNCPDWQTEIKDMLKNDPSILLVNPRRANFDASDESMTVAQIVWEYNHLLETDAVMFWFPKETLCPITLFELGVQSMVTGRNIFVGCHPDYARKLDVQVQLSLSRPDIVVRDSLEGLVQDITKWADNCLLP